MKAALGELPIDMQRTVGEINPHHYVLHLHTAQTVAAHVLQRLTQHTVKSCLSSCVSVM